jgi:D-alanyl-D-alanine carboxypeptidase
MFSFSVAARRGLLPAHLAIAMLAASFLTVNPAQAYNPPFASIVVDVNAGRVLHEEAADQLRHPASITKVMTLFLVFERLRRGQLELSTPLNVSARAAAEPPSKLGVKAGSTITVEEAIKALVTRSANDVATVVAENLGGSVGSFAQMMTDRARMLGMDRTVFRNAHGLPDARQVTTARDLAILAVAVQDRFPEQYKYFQTRSFQFEGKTHGNHNRLLGRVKGVDGIKTGFIRSSGFNLMTNAKTETSHIVTIVLGGRSGAHRDQVVTRLVERYLPTALVGDRLTPRTGLGRAASHALFAGAAIVPPPRPVDVEILVADASGTVTVAAEEIGPIEEFATLSAPDETLNQGSTAPEAQIGATSGQKAVSEPEKEPEAKQVAALASPEPEMEPESEPKKQPKAASGSSTPFVIQIAAATSERAANELLERARNRIGGPLEKAEPFVERVASTKSTFYRARFGGFAAAREAQSTCRLLQRAGFDCFQAHAAAQSG